MIWLETLIGLKFFNASFFDLKILASTARLETLIGLELFELKILNSSLCSESPKRVVSGWVVSGIRDLPFALTRTFELLPVSIATVFAKGNSDIH